MGMRASRGRHQLGPGQEEYRVGLREGLVSGPMLGVVDSSSVLWGSVLRGPKGDNIKWESVFGFESLTKSSQGWARG